MSCTAIDSTIIVKAIGMVSALGHSAKMSCAAARAGLEMARELKVMSFNTESLFGDETFDSPPVVYGHSVGGLAEGFSGVGKVLLLGEAALRDLVRQLDCPIENLRNTAMFLCLSDHAVQSVGAMLQHDAAKNAREVSEPSPLERWKLGTATIGLRLAEKVGIDIPLDMQRIYWEGAGGLGCALHDAIKMIRAGKAHRCLVGGIESRVEPGFLVPAAQLRLLRTNNNPVGLIPGEGAAFIMLDSAATAQADKGYHFSVHYAMAPEPLGSETSKMSTVMLRLMQSMVAGLGNTPVWWISNLNGTEQRAREWATAQLVCGSGTLHTQALHWMPAAFFGDTGAASATIALCMMFQAFQRGYAPSQSGVLWMSSEGGAKSLVLVQQMQV